jgi:2-polyprenyl-3-methyl-5-hydroxy-6-metoxy-1,4-benzoquinol methylase
VNKSFRWKLAQYLEVKWWNRYLSSKNPDEYILWKIDYWKQLLNYLSDVLPLQKGANVLDAGCGPAGVFIALDDCSVKAVDPLLDSYKTLPHFQPEKFCLNAINHVSDIHLAYDQLAQAVKVNGYLVVSIDAHRSSILKSIFKALPGDVLHPHQYDLKEYEQFLIDRGFVIEKTILKTPGRIFDYYAQVAKKVQS